MICNVCHTEIPDDAAFCPVCGSPVTTTNNSAETQSKQKTVLEQDNTDNTQQEQPSSKRCPVCGNYIPSEAAICPICGANVSQNNNYASAQNDVPTGYNQRSKLAAALLALFLGAFGIHNFYLGYTNKAIIQLVLGILCCGTVSGIWGFIEGIMILTESIRVDGNGMPLGK